MHRFISPRRKWEEVLYCAAGDFEVIHNHKLDVIVSNLEEIQLCTAEASGMISDASGGGVWEVRDNEVERSLRAPGSEWLYPSHFCVATAVSSHPILQRP